MPHTTHWELPGLVRKYSEIITGSEIIQSNFEMHGHPNFDDLKYVINDFSQAEECVLTEDDIHMLSITDEVASHSNSFLKIAIIATKEPMIELAKIYCAMMNDATYDAEIFNNFDDAQQWATQPTII